jgi:uncharacterized membrane protein YccC
VAEAVQKPPLLRAAARLRQVSLAVSPATAFAIRFGLVVAAAVGIGKLPGLVESHSTWILITVLMVSQPMSGGSLQKGLFRALGTLGAFFTAIFLYGLYSQDPPLLLAGLFLVQAVAAYGYTGARYQYAWFVWAFTTAIILGDAMAGQGAVETIAFERASMVGIGLLLVIVADSLFWPTRSEPALRQSLAERARQLAGALRRAIEDPLGPRHATGEAGGVGSSPLFSQLGLIGAARTEIGVSSARVEALAHAALLVEALASRARMLQRPLRVHPGAAYAAALAELGRGVEAALEEVARALAGARAPAPFAADLERALLRLKAERLAAKGAAALDASAGGRAAVLRDLVALLRTLEGVLEGSVKSARSEALADEERPTVWLQLDPFRVQLALRAGIAVCAAFLVPLALGWEVNTMVAPMAFMIAATATRGGVAQTLALLAAIVLFSWLLADLALVFFYPQAGRFPMALAYPVSVAGVFAYASHRLPQLATLRSIGTLLAILPVFGGLDAPDDVYGTYNLVCYVSLALGIGWAASRLLWPATATQLFRQRSAAQIDLCLRAFHQHRQIEDSAARSRVGRQLLTAYTRQLAQLGQLDGQAAHEPLEEALDGGRRRAHLALIQDLFDAVSGARAAPPARSMPLVERTDALGPLRDALRREDEALLASMQAVAHTLRGEAPAEAASSALDEANRAVLARLDEVRARPDLLPSVTAEEREAFLVHLDSRRLLVDRQIAIEAWLAEWQQAQDPSGGNP